MTEHATDTSDTNETHSKGYAKEHPPVERYLLVAAGIFLMLSLRAFFELVDDSSLHRTLVFVIPFFLGWMTSLLLMVGHAPLKFIVWASGAWAGFMAFVLAGASFRFEHVDDFLDSGHAILVFTTAGLLGLPFIVSAQHGRAVASRPELLGKTAWMMAVRTIIIILFTLLGWAVLLLASTLLQLVRIEVLDKLIENSWFAMGLTGLMVGVSAQTVLGWDRTISLILDLAHNLLRLLTPPIALVLSIFLLALPFVGLNEAFGSLSAGSTLLAMSAVAATLVSACVGLTPESETKTKLYTLSAKAITLLLPILGALALYAVLFRVGEYGWTPLRLAAFLASVIATLYGLTYTATLFQSGHMAAMIRARNPYLALGIIGAAILWLNPVLSPERISAESQIARMIKTDEIVVDSNYRFQRLERRWGYAGEDMMNRLKALAASGDYPGLATGLENLRQPSNNRPFRSKSAEELVQEITAVLPILSSDDVTNAPIDIQESLAVLSHSQLQDLLGGCTRLEEGAPRCIAYVADLDPRSQPPEIVIFHSTGNRFYFDGFVIMPATEDRTGYTREISELRLRDGEEDPVTLIKEGRIAIEPNPTNVLILGPNQSVDTGFSPFGSVRHRRQN